MLTQLYEIQSAATPVDEQGLVAEIDKRVKQSESILQAYHRQWFVNIAMRRGLQYIQTHTTAKAIILPPESEDRVRMIVNKIQGVHQTRVAKLVKDIPRAEVVPASRQEEDKDIARKGTKLLDWFWYNEQVLDKLASAASWMTDTGDAFLFAYWDHDKGPAIPTYQRHEGPVTGNEGYKVDEDGYILDEEGNRIEDQLTRGEAALEIIPSFDIVNDQVSETVTDSYWLIWQKGMSLRDIRRRWPEKGKLVRPEKDLQPRAYYQRRLMSLVGNQSEFFTPETGMTEDMATVKTLMQRACDQYPQGRWVVIANGVVLETSTLEEMFGDAEDYPLIKVSDIDVSGAFWSLGTVENLLPVQKGYNRTLSQIIENANNMGNIKFKVERGSQIGREALDDSGTEVIEYKKGYMVDQLQPASLPSYVSNLLEVYDKSFEDVSGQHEVSNARVPSGVKSGRAIMALQEQDDTRLAPTRMRFFRAVERLGQKVLKLYALYQVEDRTYQILGESVDDVDELQMTKEEIRSMNKDVRVQTENAIASHKRLQQEQILEMYTEGLFGQQDNPAVRQRVMKLLEFGNVTEHFEDDNQDISQAKWENERMLLEEDLVAIPDPLRPGRKVLTLEVFPFENHDDHLFEHNKFRKSIRYRRLTPEDRRRFDLHCDLHEAMRARGGPLPTQSPTPPPQQPAAPQGAPMASPPGQVPGLTPGPQGEPLPAPPPVAGPDLGTG